MKRLLKRYMLLFSNRRKMIKVIVDWIVNIYSASVLHLLGYFSSVYLFTTHLISRVYLTCVTKIYYVARYVIADALFLGALSVKQEFERVRARFYFVSQAVIAIIKAHYEALTTIIISCVSRIASAGTRHVQRVLTEFVPLVTTYVKPGRDRMRAKPPIIFVGLNHFTSAVASIYNRVNAHMIIDTFGKLGLAGDRNKINAIFVFAHKIISYADKQIRQRVATVSIFISQCWVVVHFLIKLKIKPWISFTSEASLITDALKRAKQQATVLYNTLASAKAFVKDNVLELFHTTLFVASTVLSLDQIRQFLLLFVQSISYVTLSSIKHCQIRASKALSFLSQCALKGKTSIEAIWHTFYFYGDVAIHSAVGVIPKVGKSFYFFSKGLLSIASRMHSAVAHKLGITSMSYLVDEAYIRITIIAYTIKNLFSRLKLEVGLTCRNHAIWNISSGMFQGVITDIHQRLKWRFALVFNLLLSGLECVAPKSGAGVGRFTLLSKPFISQNGNKMSANALFDLKARSLLCGQKSGAAYKQASSIVSCAIVSMGVLGWEYPVQTGDNLCITQVYDTTKDDDVLHLI